MTIAEEKKAIRDDFRKRRAAFPEADLAEAGRLAAKQILDYLREHPGIRSIACYLSIRDELPTGPLIESCRAEGIRVALPAWDASAGRYVFCWYDESDELVLGPMRIPEPASRRIAPLPDLGLVLVPGLVFSTAGKRIGYGGGWYDRLLEERTSENLCAGFCLDLQIAGSTLPAEPFDLPMDLLFTPTRTILTARA